MAGKSATGDEAAAIAAAIARFESELATASAAEPEDAIGPWQRAALLEGVGAKSDIQDPQARGGARWQS
ncbi:MAG TPA: hypothetical protein VHA80_14830 [Solirubrobacterales bacterium]|nr:hypothetical protein [Solirubrobacterales bacterium]